MIRPIILLFAVLSLTACALLPAQSPPKTDATEVPALTQTAVALTGPWSFHLGDDPQWATPTFDDTAWEHLSPQQGWGAQGHFATAGFAWYRLAIHSPSAAQTADLELLLPVISDVCEVFWNGQKVSQTGAMPSHFSWPAYQKPHAFPLGPRQSGVLAIRAWKAPLVSYDSGLHGGLEATPILGTPTVIALLISQSRYNLLRQFQFSIGLSLLYAVVALVSFGMFLRRRDQPLLLWLGFFSLASLLQSNWLHVLFHFSYGMEALGSCLHQPMLDIATWFLLIHLFDLRRNSRVMRLARIFIAAELILLALDAISILLWSAGWPQFLDGIVSELILIPELFPLILVGFAFGRRLGLTPWLVALVAVAINFFLEVGSFITQGERFTHWRLGNRLLNPILGVNGNTLTLQQIAATGLLLSLLLAIYQNLVHEETRRAKIEQEFRSAQELQRVLIPEQPPAIPGYEVTSAYQPAQEVGGDFFQVIPQPDGSALLIVGDVSGKGLTAAMSVSHIIGVIHTLAEETPGPAEMLSGINRRLQGRLRGGFATCVVLRLDSHGAISLASAGHPAPFLNGDELALPPALPLGITLDADFEERQYHLAIGDQLTLYSDGLLEARNDRGELYGFDRLQALAATRPNAPEAARAAVAFGQDDDITVVTVTRLDLGVVARTSLSAPELIANIRPVT